MDLCYIGQLKFPFGARNCKANPLRLSTSSKRSGLKSSATGWWLSLYIKILRKKRLCHITCPRHPHPRTYGDLGPQRFQPLWVYHLPYNRHGGNHVSACGTPSCPFGFKTSFNPKEHPALGIMIGWTRKDLKRLEITNRYSQVLDLLPCAFLIILG